MTEVEQLRADLARVNTRLRALAIALVAVAVGALVPMFRTGPVGTLTAKEFVLVGDDGTVRGRLATTGLGDAQLTLADSAGKERVWLQASDEHGTFEVTDAQRHTLVRLSAVENISGLHLANGAGHQTAQISSSIENASVTLVDLDRSLSAQLRADPSGTDLQLSRNTAGEPPRLATLSAGPADTDHGASLVLAGPQQFIAAKVDAADGEPRVTIAGETRLESRTGASESPWQQFDREEP
jgi:hypothetical protein